MEKASWEPARYDHRTHRGVTERLDAPLLLPINRATIMPAVLHWPRAWPPGWNAQRTKYGLVTRRTRVHESSTRCTIHARQELFRGRGMPNFSSRLTSVRSAMPRCFAARVWFPAFFSKASMIFRRSSASGS